MPGETHDLPPLPTTLRITEPLCAVFRRSLREEGLKYTAERARILDGVVSMDGPFRVEELLGKLKGGGRVSKATTYRTVHLLQRCGILQQVLLRSDEAHYQLAYGKSSSALLVPVDGAPRSVEVPGLETLCRAACTKQGLTLEGFKLIVYGKR